MKRDIATLTRWLHIYLSTFSFLLIFFFAVTGITLNHPDWLEQRQIVKKHSGKLDSAWFATENSIAMKKFEIAEYFRNSFAIKAPVSDFVVDDSQCDVTFKGPGYAADVFIDRVTGEFELTITSSGLIAVMNDLHKGRDTSSGWKWTIDAAAIFMIMVSLTGFVMIFFLKKKRTSGLLVVTVGATISLLLYWLF